MDPNENDSPKKNSVLWFVKDSGSHCKRNGKERQALLQNKNERQKLNKRVTKDVERRSQRLLGLEKITVFTFAFGSREQVLKRNQQQKNK